MDLNMIYTKENRKDNYIKMMQVNDCWLFQTEHFSEVMMNVNDHSITLGSKSS